MKIALIGDYQADVAAHWAIPRALSLAGAELSVAVEPEWIHSTEAGERDWHGFDGTCAGYQHAALEFARNALGYTDADSLEDRPDTQMPLIAPLVCRLAGTADAINILAASRAAEIYRCERVVEEYNCGFGLNAELLEIFSGSNLRFSGFDDHGDPRILEIPQHRYFIATAFQPERSAYRRQAHPLIRAYLAAAL